MTPRAELLIYVALILWAVALVAVYLYVNGCSSC